MLDWCSGPAWGLASAALGPARPCGLLTDQIASHRSLSQLVEGAGELGQPAPVRSPSVVPGASALASAAQRQPPGPLQSPAARRRPHPP